MNQTYNIAYALYLGSSVEFMPNISAEVAYSYRSMGKTKSINGTDFNFRGHNITTGVRFDL